MAGQHPLPLVLISHLDHVRYWTKWLRENGIPEEHGLYPNRPLNGRESRALAALAEAADRVAALRER